MARKSLKPSKTQKKQIVAFKVEDDLAEFLDKLPNKSEFIRKAILAQFGMTCPLCAGAGVVRQGHSQPLRAGDRRAQHAGRARSARRRSRSR